MRNYIFILFLLLVSCGQNNSNVRDLSTSSGLFNNNDIISNVDFVYLDASCMIGDIGRIRSFNEDFYIWDKQQKMIALFNKDGKYKDQLKRVGRGSQEYIDIADFDICQSSGNVYILCGPPKILIFDKDLNFEKEITLESFYNAIAVYKDGVLLYSGEKGVIDYISFVDNSTKRIAKFNTDVKYMDKNLPCFIRSSEGLYFQDVISDVISQNKKIRYKYFEHTVEKTRRYRHNGNFYEVSPFALIWDDENYYLIGFDDVVEEFANILQKLLNLFLTFGRKNSII